ncbi:MAG: hypothetical protein HQL71_08535 [Magnetococcales bacterium]|nr:hypothetical protein [Magnetococcales bacterium]
MSFLLTIHLIAALIWVGGMFFTHFVLRPSAEFLPLPDRINLWAKVLQRFLTMVWLAIIVLPVSGYWMVFSYYGGLNDLALHINIMQIIGWIMMAIFIYVYMGPYKQLKIRVKEELFPEAGMFMLKIRRLVGINLLLGSFNVAIAVAGRYLF